MCCSIAQAESSKKPIPKWKLAQMAKIANAANVCQSPTINPKTNVNNLTTAFYAVNLMPDAANQFLSVVDGHPVVTSGQQADVLWLLSEVGAGLYKISTCAEERPVCLTTTADKSIILATCNEYGYGDQVWWLKGYVVGKNKGGWFFGNDGVGQMECLVVNESEAQLTLQTCSEQQSGWRFTRTDRASKTSVKKKIKPLALPIGEPITTYQCNSGASISTHYDEMQDLMWVNYNGQTLSLPPMISGSGAKFGDSQQAWGWWTKGSEGMVFQTNAEEDVLENCVEVTDNHQTNSLAANVWTAQDFGDGASVADCTDCEEDLSVVINCQKGAETAEVSVYMDVDKAVKQQLMVMQAEVDDQTYQYSFESQYFEMIGHHIATFHISKSDPMLTALQQGKQVHFTVAGDDGGMTIGLAGSKKAIGQFKQFCGWATD